MVTLRIEDLSFSYRQGKVLDAISFETGEGELLGIVGPNGCGKTTLIKCIDQILLPDRGSIRLDGTDLQRLSRRELSRRISYVPQAISSSGSSTVFEIVLMGRRPYLNWSVSESDELKVIEAIKLLGIENLAFRNIRNLSGGERQRVMIARALVQDTQILLLDEPTSNLDVHYQMGVLEVISGLARERDLTVIMAIHDLNLASRYCTDLLVLNRGTVYGQGSPSDLLSPEMIREVYGIEALVKHDPSPPYVVPIRAVRERP
ncbi:MAG: iron ABC transporter ATP-binding protein [Methanoculleus sp. SDB]|nr:MAG: iron ABC transporter ATP-binding protein [Methanoculleus sp. SDB]